MQAREGPHLSKACSVVFCWVKGVYSTQRVASVHLGVIPGREEEKEEKEEGEKVISMQENKKSYVHSMPQIREENIQALQRAGQGRISNNNFNE